MRRTTYRLCAILIFTFSTTICHAADRNPFIAEISTFMILVERLSPTLTAAGLTKSDIEQRVEFVCRRNSLPVSPTADAWLYVRVSALAVRVGGRDVGFSCVVEMSLNQGGKTPVNGTLYPITSWTAGSVMRTSSGQSVWPDIKDTLQEKVEEFANAWLTSHEQTNAWNIKTNLDGRVASP